MSAICVVGSGYVGLTTAACFAHLGHTVVCTDIDAERIERLQAGECPILEQGLDNLLREGLSGGRLRFELGNSAAGETEFVYLCVPTPQGPDGSADLSYIEAAASEIAPLLVPDTVVINKSTVPVGSTRVVERVLGRSDVHVVSNPEFLREGTAVHDFLNPDRIVIGADDQSAAVRVASLYLGIAAPLIVTDPPSAETIKYAANAFLATKISFVNAIAAVCEAVGADMNDVVLGMGYDRRIGSEFLRPGPGWGGSCFVGDETLLVRREGHVRLLRFDELAAEVASVGADGWEALSWRPGDPTPVFLPVSRFTSRSYDGDVITVRTKMGRRVTVTADHPLITRQGPRLAEELTTDDWLPVAQGAPMALEGSFRPRRPEESHLDRIDWSASDVEKAALLRRVGAGDPARSFEFGTASRWEADVVSRLLGDLRVMPEVTFDAGCYRVRTAVPASYRRLDDDKSVAWVRVVGAERRRFQGTVFSLTVPETHTVVTSFGLVASNCFPKDSRALVRIAEDAGYDFDLLKGVITVNEEQFDRVAAKVVELVGGSVEGVPIAVWGLTFKARTDDLRESPALAIVERLLAAGAKVRAYDPSMPDGKVDARRADLLGGIELAADPYAACEGAACLVVLTEWDEFRWLDFDKVADALAAKRVVDGRNLIDRESLRRRGFTYAGVGRV